MRSEMRTGASRGTGNRMRSTARSGSSTRRVLRVGAALVVGAVVAGCGTGSTKAKGPATVVLVTYSSFALDKQVQAQVEKTLGAKIELRQSGDAGEALSKAILNAGKPEGDVFFGVDNTLMTRALDAKLFDSYAPRPLAQVPPAMDLDTSRHLSPIDSGSVCINYDKKWFADKAIAPPTSFDDLADARYKDLLVTENPVTSSPGLVFMMATHARYGDAADDYWRKLKANGVAVVGSWDEAAEKRYTVAGGDRPLVVSYASSPPAEVVYSEGKLTEPTSGVAEGTCALQVEMAGLLRGAAHPALGRKLLDAMLSIEWQQALPLTNFVDPARRDAVLPDVYQKFALHPAAPITLDPATVGASRDQWVDEWRKILE